MYELKETRATTSSENENAVHSSTFQKLSAIWDIEIGQSKLKVILHYDLWRYDQMYTHKENGK